MGTTDIDIQVFKDEQHEHFQNLKKKLSMKLKKMGAQLYLQIHMK